MFKSAKAKSVAIPVLATLSLLVLIEIVLRLTMIRCTHPEPNLCQFGTVSYHYNHKPGGGDLEPSQDGIWAIWPHRPYHVQVNSQGLRNVEDVDWNSDLRILAVGDSFTFGPYVPNEDTWPGWLETILESEIQPDRTVQVLNAGVAGYTIQDEYYYLVERGLSLEPDLVVLAFFPNDISDFRGIQRDYLSRPVHLVAPTSASFLAREAFIRLEGDLAILQLVGRVRSAGVAAEVENRQLAGNTPTNGTDKEKVCDPYVRPDTLEADLCWAQFGQWMRRTIRALNENGVPLLLVAIPDHKQIPETGYASIPQDFLAEIAAEEQVPFLNLLPGLREQGDIESLYLLRFDPSEDKFTGNGHMSSNGYRIVARLIADELTRLGFLRVQ